MPISRERLIQELTELAPEPDREALSRILLAPLNEAVGLRAQWKEDWAHKQTDHLTDEALFEFLLEAVRDQAYDRGYDSGVSCRPII